MREKNSTLVEDAASIGGHGRSASPSVCRERKKPAPRADFRALNNDLQSLVKEYELAEREQYSGREAEYRGRISFL